MGQAADEIEIVTVKRVAIGEFEETERVLQKEGIDDVDLMYLKKSFEIAVR